MICYIMGFWSRDGRVFNISPKYTKRVGSVMITPGMSVVVTTPCFTSIPVGQYRSLVNDAFMRIYGIDISSSAFNSSDFDVEVIG